MLDLHSFKHAVRLGLGSVAQPDFVADVFVQVQLRLRDAKTSQREFDPIGWSVEQYCASYDKATSCRQ